MLGFTVLSLWDGSVALRIFQEKIFNEINGLLGNNLLNATEPHRLMVE